MSSRLPTSVKVALVALTAGLMAAPAAFIPSVGHAQDRYDGYCYMRKNEARTDDAIVGAVAGGAIGGSVANTHNKGVGTVLGAAVGAAVGANVGNDSVKCYNGEYHSFERGGYAPPPPPQGYETVYYRSRPDATYYRRVEYTTTTTYDDGNGGYAQRDVQYQGYAPQPADTAPPAYAPPPANYAPQPAYAPAPAYAQPAPQQDYNGGNGYAANDGVQGFRDEDGYWHRGQPRAIGWQDEDGNWHEGRVVAYGWRDSDGHWHEDRQQDPQGNNGGY